MSTTKLRSYSHNHPHLVSKMTISEFALFVLAANVTIDNAGLRGELSHAKSIMQKYTGNSFYFYQQVESPSSLYLFGEWASIDQHVNQFATSPENMAAIGSLLGYVTPQWAFHADVSNADLPLPTTPAEKAKALCGDQVLSIAQYNIQDGKKAEFQSIFDANKNYLENYLTEGKMNGGWRIDTAAGQEEFVLLAPYKNVQQDFDFAKTQGFPQFDQIRACLNSTEVRHVRLLDL
jgi:hypothetical protein